MITLGTSTLTPVAIFGLGHTELIIIAIVLVLLFGAKRIPELGKSVGLGISNFKKGLKKAEEEGDEEDEEPPKALEGNDVSDVPVIEAKNEKTKA